MKKRLAVIGGGVSGVTLARLVQGSFNVTIFERESSLLQKLLRTGNGRANIYNRNIHSFAYNDEHFLSEHLPHIVKTLDDLFSAFNIVTYTDTEGRVYPYSRSAKALRALLIKDLKAEVKLEHNVEEIVKVRDKYKVDGEEFDAVALTMGSSAGLFKYPLDNGNAALLSALDLETTALVPTIKTIKVKENLKRIEHERVTARVTLMDDENVIASDVGEVLFKKDGLSGIVSFILSSYLEWAVVRYPKRNYYLTLDLMPEFSARYTAEIIKTTDDLDNVFSPNISHYLKGRNEPLLDRVKALTFTPIPKNNPENTSAMHGGIKISKLNTDFEVRESPNLFALGEVINIDGICGGYNLAFAFYSAKVVSDALLRKL